MMKNYAKHVVHNVRTLLFVSATTAALGGCLLNSKPVPVVYDEGTNFSLSAMPALRNGERVITVRSGDSVSLLAQRYHADFKKFASRNNLRSPYVIYPGQRLVLPPWQSDYNSNPPEAVVASAPRKSSPTKQVVIAGRTQSAEINASPLDAPDTAQPSSASTSTSDLSRVTDITSSKANYATGANIPVPGAKPQDVAAQAERQFAAGNSWHGKPATSVARNMDISGGASTRASVQSSAVSKSPRVDDIAPVNRQGFIWPVQGKVVLGYGAGPGGLFNDGINIAAERGTAILATDNGVVTYVGNELRGFGNLILIKHADGYVSAYAHTENPLVARGDIVTRGQRISSVGATGAVNRPQLHFEIRLGRKSRDPVKYLPQAVASR
ncbi:peptidoglycan DD-metalloendopeptidase family protein [uncultured Thalassospira sp.]|uniref:peptidoglycan DD-metalloendopeptidase family protein n=1 Tax=uncultured Thalassospira sp. TaxID=404382 RepID=UPI0030DA679C|tara:strand:+ start:4049 stop:5194 length:1146 start_codon:yes stop_codon:yes gene_type:complete